MTIAIWNKTHAIVAPFRAPNRDTDEYVVVDADVPTNRVFFHTKIDKIRVLKEFTNLDEFYLIARNQKSFNIVHAIWGVIEGERDNLRNFKVRDIHNALEYWNKGGARITAKLLFDRLNKAERLRIFGVPVCETRGDAIVLNTDENLSEDLLPAPYLTITNELFAVFGRSSMIEPMFICIPRGITNVFPNVTACEYIPVLIARDFEDYIEACEESLAKGRPQLPHMTELIKFMKGEPADGTVILKSDDATRKAIQTDKKRFFRCIVKNLGKTCSESFYADRLEKEVLSEFLDFADLTMKEFMRLLSSGRNGERFFRKYLPDDVLEDWGGWA